MLRFAGDTDSFLIKDDAGESTLNKVAAQAEAAVRKNAAARTGRGLPRISGSSSYRCMSASSGIESPMAMKVAWPPQRRFQEGPSMPVPEFRSIGRLLPTR